MENSLQAVAHFLGGVGSLILLALLGAAWVSWYLALRRALKD